MFSAVCGGCGAEVVFDEGEALSTCAFCKRALARKEYTKTEDFPELLIPFKITPDEAKRRLLDWCGKNSGLKEAKILKKNADALEGFYLPYMLVKGPSTCSVKREETARVYQMRGFFEEKFVNVSNNLNNDVLDGMEPYDTSELREFDFSFLAGHRVKIADLKDSDAESRVAREIAADYEPYAAKTFETKAVKLDPSTANMMTMSVVLPAYYLRVGEVIAAVNGQTGKVAVRERKDRFLLPWQLKPIAAILLLIAATFTITFFASHRDMMATLFLTGILSIFFLVVVSTAYHDEYAGTRRFKLRRRILTSDDKRPLQTEPEFYEKIDGASVPVKLKFTTPLRTLKSAMLAVVVTLLPLILAFIFNGFSPKGLTLGGSAVWLCIFVPVSPIYFIKFARLNLYERPLIYLNKDGKTVRYRKKIDAGKVKEVLKSVISPAPLIGIAIALIVLWINVTLTLHWDSYGSDTTTAESGISTEYDISLPAEEESAIDTEVEK